MKKFFCVLIALCLLFLFAGCTGDTVVATVGREKIYLADYNALYGYMRDMYLSSYGVDISLYPDMQTAMRDSVIDSLVAEKVEILKARELGFYDFTSADNAIIEQSYNDSVADMRLALEEALLAEEPGLSNDELKARRDELLNEQLAAMNTSLEGYRDVVAQSYALSLLYDYALEDLDVSDEAVRSEYENQQQLLSESYAADPTAFETDGLTRTEFPYTPSGYRRIKHILIPFNDDISNSIYELRTAGDDAAADALRDEALAALSQHANEVRALIAADGSDFDDVLAAYTGDTGALYYTDGYVIGQNSESFRAELVNAAFSLEPEGAVSPLFYSDSGWHIIRLITVYEEYFLPYDEASDELRDMTLSLMKDNAYSACCAQWRGEYEIKIYPERTAEQ